MNNRCTLTEFFHQNLPISGTHRHHQFGCVYGWYAGDVRVLSELLRLPGLFSCAILGYGSLDSSFSNQEENM